MLALSGLSSQSPFLWVFCPCEFCAEMRSWPSLHIPIPKLQKASLGVTTAYILFSYIPFRCLCSLSVLVCESCSVDVEMLYVSVPFSKPAAGPGCNHSDNILVIDCMAAEPTFGEYSRQNSKSTSDQSPESCRRLGQIELTQKAALRVNSTVSHLVLPGV